MKSINHNQIGRKTGEDSLSRQKWDLVFRAGVILVSVEKLNFYKRLRFRRSRATAICDGFDALVAPALSPPQAARNPLVQDIKRLIEDIKRLIENSIIILH